MKSWSVVARPVQIDGQFPADAAAAAVQQQHPVGQADRLGDIMGDEQHCLAVLANQADEQFLHLLACGSSRPPAGSSMSRIRGARTSTRANATRCFIPPDKARGR